MNAKSEQYSGSCACGHIQYSVQKKPLIVHCCHCTWCQRESGSAFAINLLVESCAVEVSHGECEWVNTPSKSGNGQMIARCPKCRIALWSHYYQGGPNISFIRAGTLSEPNMFPPDIHIYTSTKLPWVVIPEDVLAFPELYNPAKVWPDESLQRFLQARSGG